MFLKLQSYIYVIIYMNKVTVNILKITTFVYIL